MIYFPHIALPQRLSESERMIRVEMNIRISKLEILFPRIKLTLLDFCLYYFSIAVLKHGSTLEDKATSKRKNLI